MYQYHGQVAAEAVSILCRCMPRWGSTFNSTQAHMLIPFPPLQFNACMHTHVSRRCMRPSAPVPSICQALTLSESHSCCHTGAQVQTHLPQVACSEEPMTSAAHASARLLPVQPPSLITQPPGSHQQPACRGGATLLHLYRQSGLIHAPTMRSCTIMQSPQPPDLKPGVCAPHSIPPALGLSDEKSNCRPLQACTGLHDD